MFTVDPWILLLLSTSAPTHPTPLSPSLTAAPNSGKWIARLLRAFTDGAFGKMTPLFNATPALQSCDFSGC